MAPSGQRVQCEYCQRVVNESQVVPMDNGSYACDFCCIDVECSRCRSPYVVPEQVLDGAYVCPECQGYSGWWSWKGAFVVLVTLASAGLVWEYAGPEYLPAIIGLLLLYMLFKYGLYMTILFATFPGVIIHEIAHKKSCDILNIHVHDYSYFRFGSQLGYVKPEPVKSFWKNFIISSAPLFLNTVLAVLITVMSMSFLVAFPLWLQWTGIWLAISMGVHAIPSSTDLDNIWTHIKRDWRRNPTVVLSIPFAVLLSLSHRFSYVDLIYGGALVLFSYGLGLYLGLPSVYTGFL